VYGVLSSTTIDDVVVIVTVDNPFADAVFAMDQTVVEQTGERVHVHRGRVVLAGQVQSRRAREDVA